MKDIKGQLLASMGGGLGELVLKVNRYYTSHAPETQEKLLKDIIKDNSGTEFGKKYGFEGITDIKQYQDTVPLSTYCDYAPYIDRMLAGENGLITAKKITRYAKTSGSAGKPKIIPQSKAALFLLQCSGFCSPVACASRYYKKNGSHLPPQKGLLVLEATSEKLSDGSECSCSSVIPLIMLKPLTPFFTTSPKEILFPDNEQHMDMHYLKLRYALPERDVSYIGCIAVTIVETMFEYLEQNWELLVKDIRDGTIDKSIDMPFEVRKKLEAGLKPDPVRARELEMEFRLGFNTPIAPRIWKKLGWMYGMMSGNLSVYAEKLRRYVGDLPSHNMGYGSTEALMAVPLALNTTDAVLLPRSAFYEFLPVGAKEGMRPLTIEQVEQGKDYEIIITNLSGLYRYRMEDVVHITRFYGNTPMVEFRYRLNQVMNITNEKTTQEMLDAAVGEAQKELDCSFAGHSVYEPKEAVPPHYMFLIEPSADSEAPSCEVCRKVLDEKLSQSNILYGTVRNMAVLGECEVHYLFRGTYQGYKDMLRAKGVNVNQLKPVSVINTPEKADYFFSHIEV